MQPSTSGSTFAPTATPTPTYQPLSLKAYDESANADANASSAAIQAALGKFETSRRNPLDIYNDAVNQLGVGDVRTRVTNLRNQLLNTENLLNGVDSSVTGRTQGSLVTEAQRQRLVNLEREPITKDYNTQTQGLANENATLSDLLNQAQLQTNMAVQGQTAREQALQFALQQASAREQAAEELRRWQAEMAQKDRELAQRNSSSAGLNAQVAQLMRQLGASTAGGPSQAQINSAAWLASPEARAIPNPATYTSPNWKDIMAQQNPLLRVGNGIVGAANATSNAIGKLLGLRK